MRTGGARLAQRGQRRVGAEGVYTHRRVGAEGMYRRRSYDWCATNSAPSRSRSSASSEPCNLLSSHGMDQHSHHTQAVRVNDDLIRAFRYPMFHPMVRDARACSTALRHKSSAITITLRHVMHEICREFRVQQNSEQAAISRQSLRMRHQQTQIPSRPVPGAPSAKDSHNRAPSADYSFRSVHRAPWRRAAPRSPRAGCVCVARAE